MSTNKASLFLSAYAVVLETHGRIVAHQRVTDLQMAFAAAADILKKAKGLGNITAWLGGRQCRPFLLPDQATGLSQGDLLALATRLAPQETGLTDQCTVWVDSSNSSRLVAAVATEVLDAIERLGQRQINSIQPYWAAVLRWQLDQGGAIAALGLLEPDALTVLAGGAERGFMHASTTCPLDSAEQGHAVWARSKMQFDCQGGPMKLASVKWPMENSGARGGPLRLSEWLEVKS